MSEENKNNLNKKLSNFKPQKFNNLWIILIILTGIAIMWNSYQGGEPVKTEWFSVKEKMIPAGDIEKIIFGKKEVKPPPPETEEMATSSENGNTENP